MHLMRRGLWTPASLSPRAQRVLRAASRSGWVRVVVLGAAVCIAVLSIYRRFHTQDAVPCYADFDSYYRGALALRHGVAPYGALADWIRGHTAGAGSDPFAGASCQNGALEFSYTPFFGLLLIPFTWLPYGPALLLWDACSLLLLAGAIYAFLRAARMSPTLIHVVLLAVAAMLASPFRFELYYAQADLLILFVICAALWARLAGYPTLAGVALAIACAIAPALLLFLIFLLWKREIRFAAVTLVGALVLIFAPFLWLGGKALRDLIVIWGAYWGAHGVVLSNDSPRGVLLRLLTPNAYARPLVAAPGLVTPLWLLAAVAVLLLALARIAPRPLARDERSLLDIGLAIAAMLLISPWSENNQFTFLLLAFLAVYVCLRQADWRERRTRVLLMGLAGAALLFFVLGDDAQNILAARMDGAAALAPLYVLLAAVYLYPLLAICGLTVYAQGFASGSNGRVEPNRQHPVPAAGSTAGVTAGGVRRVNPTFKRLASPALDPLGYALLMSRAADLGLAHRHGLRTAPRVALTFDDGPVLGGTEVVLDALGELGVPGTFFCIGANALLHPEIIRRADAAGHVIGAHSMHHGRIQAVSLTDTAHIDECLAVLREVLGRTPALYRPPWGWLTPWEALRLRQRGLAIIRWDVETLDSERPCPPGDAMAAWTLPRVRPGTIIVFHDGFTHADRYEKPETVRALRLLVPELKARGYTFVTVPELLGIPAYQDGAVTAGRQDETRLARTY
jgi:peptidoglycan/xylan/chitin deacetylase (PgdA/CDA1 family)